MPRYVVRGNQLRFVLPYQKVRLICGATGQRQIVLRLALRENIPLPLQQQTDARVSATKRLPFLPLLPAASQGGTLFAREGPPHFVLRAEKTLHTCGAMVQLHVAFWFTRAQIIP